MRQVFAGNEVADEILNHSIMVHHVYIKPGGAPDKSCVFPGMTGLSGPTRINFFHVHVQYIHCM